MKQLHVLVAMLALAPLVAPVVAGGQQIPPATIRANVPATQERAPTNTATCAEVSAWINRILPGAVVESADTPSVPQEISLGQLRTRDLDCAAVPALVSGIPFELSRIFFDRTLHSWEFVLRCAHTTDCVPFLIRWRPPAAQDSSSSPVRIALPLTSNTVSRIDLRGSQHFLLRPGQTVTLLWDQDGIRVILPVVCLDRGNVGDSIRVRIKNGERILKAQIINQSLLRAAL